MNALRTVKSKVLIIAVSMFLVCVIMARPVQCEESGGFTFLQAYWGTTQAIEVSAGDVATLTVVLKQEKIFELKGLEATLPLPPGFEAVGGTENASIIYTGTVSMGSLVKLEFPLFITVDVQRGSYTADLMLKYYAIGFEYEDEIEITFEVTGKPVIAAKVSNASLYEGEQKVLVELSNSGDAIAKSLKILKVSSTSASAELESIGFLGNLEPEDNVDVMLSLFVPAGLEGKTVLLTLEGSCLGPTNVVYSFTETLQLPVAEVEEVEEAEITTQFPAKAAAPGDTFKFAVRLESSFEGETQFELSVDSIPQNWTVSIRSSSGDLVSKVILDGNTFVDLVVEVTSPDSAKVGEEHELIVRAESNDQNITCSLPISVKLTEVVKVEEVKITAKFPDVTVEAGKVVQYPITVANLGDADKLLLLSIKPPNDWKAVFKSGVLEVSRLYMEAGKSDSLVVEVTPPSTVDVGAYTIPVQVKSENDAVYAEIDLKATIIGSYALKLELSTLLTSTTTGGSTSFTAKVTNAGFTSVTGIGLNVAAPENWELSVNPIRADLLKPQESFSFNVVAQTPENTVAGDYMITVTGSSDQVSSDQVQVRVTVATSTSWGLYGLGLAAVFIAALVLVFIKFKRR